MALVAATGVWLRDPHGARERDPEEGKQPRHHFPSLGSEPVAVAKRRPRWRRCPKRNGGTSARLRRHHRQGRIRRSSLTIPSGTVILAVAPPPRVQPLILTTIHTLLVYFPSIFHFRLLLSYFRIFRFIGIPIAKNI